MRSSENFDNDEAYIIQYRKEGYLDQTRFYISVGKREKGEFLFIKKCEIPILKPSAELLEEDNLNAMVEIMDFGDDKVYIYTWINDKIDKPFKLKYKNEIFVPFFEDFNIYLMGNDDYIFLKSILVELFDGNDYFLEKQRKPCHTCLNCMIF